MSIILLGITEILITYSILLKLNNNNKSFIQVIACQSHHVATA